MRGARLFGRGRAPQEISAIKETHASKATDELRSFAQHYAELEANITADSGRRADR